MLLYKRNNHSINRNVFPFFFGLIFFVVVSISQQHVSNTLDPKYKVQVDTHMWPCALIDNGNIKHDYIKHQSGNRFPTLQLDLKVPVKRCKQNSMYIKGMPGAFCGRSFSRTYLHRSKTTILPRNPKPMLSRFHW